MKIVASAFVSGMIIGSGGVDLPMTALPSFVFILVAYAGLALWELRDLLRPAAEATTKPATTSAVQPGRVFGPAVRPQTRSSTA
ncbi:MAG TPA: hypothetical protein VJB57_17345 [Dehalococcoidia bacterium]|nr:hypothetical protein [Dehalococcoidia bacterium]